MYFMKYKSIFFLVVFRFVEMTQIRGVLQVWLFLIPALPLLSPQDRGVLPHLGRLQLGHGLDQGGEGEPWRRRAEPIFLLIGWI